MFEKYQEIIPNFEAFLESIQNFNLVSFRVNTLKISHKEIEERMHEYALEKVKWYRHAYIVNKNKEKLTRSLEHFLGLIYIQRLESMVPALILSPREHELILDLCAAPGSKTTQMAQMMKNTGRIIANDIKEKRLRALFGNIEKMGVINVSVTKYDGRRFPCYVKFDKVLVDVPCSGEGRNFQEKPIWLSKKLFSKQLKLLEHAIELCKEGGTIVYSTCTLSPIENELVVSKILSRVENMKLEKIKIKHLKFVKGVEEWKNYRFTEEVKKCLRLYPHISGTGGFFVAKFKKLC